MTLDSLDENMVATLEGAAEQANAAYVQILRHVWKSLELSRACGQWLDSAQSLVPRGNWNEWLDNNFAGPASEAKVYVQVYQNWPRVKQNFQLQNNCLVDDSEEVS